MTGSEELHWTGTTERALSDSVLSDEFNRTTARQGMDRTDRTDCMN